MAPHESARRLIVTADDFGSSAAANQAVIGAFQQGVLTCASLMVNGPAWAEAVALARQCPDLGVGLHLTLVCGRSTLPHNEIPDLVDPKNQFRRHPARTGLRYFTKRQLLPQLLREIHAQFEKFRRTGLCMDHVNGHLNLHLHPTLFRLLMAHAKEWGVTHFRLTHDPLALNLRLVSGRWLYRLSHALIFGWLARRAQPRLRRLGVRHTARVCGLLQSGKVTESFILGLLPQLPPGDSELYAHPSLDHSPAEFNALVSPRVIELVRTLKIELIRYQDL